MDPHDVIESYVHDVARRLPRARRDDVAFELRTVLADELAARAEAGGRAPDTELAMRTVRAFGRPADAAAGYHKPFTIVGPRDTWSFVMLGLAGAYVLMLLLWPTAQETYRDAAGEFALATLSWLGVLVLGYALKNLIQRHRPDAFGWRPRPVRHRDTVRRPLHGASALLCGGLLALYLMPATVVAAVTGGRVDTDGLAYSDSFTGAARMPWLAGMLVAAAVVQAVVALQGRWHRANRLLWIYLLLLIGTQLGWHVRYGNIFADPATDRLLAPVLAITSGLLMLAGGYQIYREATRVRPAPTPT